ISLFGNSIAALPEIKITDTQPATKKERLSWEKELLGLYLSDHPVREYREYFKKIGVPIREINPQMVENNISIGGVISKVQKIYLKNQKMMLFVTLEDTEGSLEILVFPKVLEATSSIWEEDKIVLASGKLSNKDGEYKILCDSVKTVGQEDL